MYKSDETLKDTYAVLTSVYSLADEFIEPSGEC